MLKQIFVMTGGPFCICFVLKLANTVKFLNFGTPEILAVIYLKFKQIGQTLKGICQNGANGIADSEDPDQTAPS